jgi:putative ABC transport system permease protein
LFFGYRCVNEAVPERRKNQVGLFVVRVDDPSRSAAIASQIDAMFASSPAPTKTESERAFSLGFVAMSSAIIGAVRLVSYIILVILLLVIGNTLAMGVRERSSELATLRALGFKRHHLVALVLGESAAIGLGSATLGILAAPSLIRGFLAFAKRYGSMPRHLLSAETLVTGALAALAVSLLAGAVPAYRAGKLVIADALRQAA